jgi:DNA-binding MarR family transcriptional regulator/ribosomal protein S18 acetylase RimI-like enzyme
MEALAGLGALALGSRLKALSDALYAAVDRIYRIEGAPLQARWFPVLRLLEQQGPLSVSEIAVHIGQTHAAVSQLARRLAAAGWVQRLGDGRDRRRSLLRLVPAARPRLRALVPLWSALEHEVLAGGGADLLRAVERIEAAERSEGLAPRVLRKRLASGALRLRILPYVASRRAAFRDLNLEWLRKYFKVEAIDRRVLGAPERHIIGRGGRILFAALGERVVGTVALMPHPGDHWELTKMAVTEAAQGLGIGRKLMQSAIAAYRGLGGRELFLETNSRLAPAIALYESVGFQHQAGPRPGSHYRRSDVYMIWRATPARRFTRRRAA